MNKKIPSLNGLRAICILMVIGSHLQAHGFLYDNKIIKYAGKIIFNGPLAVNVFFIISGFLITGLLINEQILFNKISLKKFYLRRILRIFPAYYSLLIIYVLLQSWNYFFISPTTWISIALFAKQFSVGPWETDHFWSLSVEEVFYLVWPFLFIRFYYNIVVISITIIFIILTIRITVANFPSPIAGKTIFTTGDALLMGCLASIFYNKIVQIISNHKMLVYISPIMVLSAIIFYDYSFYRLANSIGIPAVNHLILRISYAFFGDLGLITNLSIIIIVIASINFQNQWFKLLNFPIMNHIGKLSYSLYLWQQLFIANREWAHKMPLPFLIMALYATAYFSYRFIEQPFINLKRKFNLESATPSASEMPQMPRTSWKS